MYLVSNTWVPAVTVSNVSSHYLPNCSPLDIGVFGYIGIFYHKEHLQEVWQIPPGTPVYVCVYVFIIYTYMTGPATMDPERECVRACVRDREHAHMCLFT
jgi:hypothetical protein